MVDLQWQKLAVSEVSYLVNNAKLLKVKDSDVEAKLASAWLKGFTSLNWTGQHVVPERNGASPKLWKLIRQAACNGAGFAESGG